MIVLRTIFIVIFFLALSFPAFKNFFSVDLNTKLQGVEKKAKKKVALSTDTFFSGAFQKNFEKNIKRIPGLRAFLIKTDNQINFSLFKQLSSNYKASVVLGKDNNLIERAYIKSAIKIDAVKSDRLAKTVSRMKELQDLLHSKGVGFLLLISPNKPSLYPEYIPQSFQVAGIENRKSTYDKILPLLEQHQINYLDGHAFFAARKATSPYMFFSHSGTHWNEYGACLVTQEIVNRMEAQIGKKLRRFSCEPVVMSQIPAHADRDLTRLANIWTPEATYRPSAKPKHKTIKSKDIYKPKVLIVGTSFSWAILRYLDRHHIYKKRDMYYYFRTKYTYPHRPPKPINKDNVNWEKNVFSKDIVILEVNEAFAHRAGYGFIPRALGLKTKDEKLHLVEKNELERGQG